MYLSANSRRIFWASAMIGRVVWASFSPVLSGADSPRERQPLWPPVSQPKRRSQTAPASGLHALSPPTPPPMAPPRERQNGAASGAPTLKAARQMPPIVIDTAAVTRLATSAFQEGIPEARMCRCPLPAPRSLCCCREPGCFRRTWCRSAPSSWPVPLSRACRAKDFT